MSMIEKNWLIRTKQHQVLGPISKSKVIELLEKESLLDDDELSSGNGYWFQVQEKELMDKYIYGDIIQSFNPISEAENVLTQSLENKSQTSSFKPSTLPKAENASVNTAIIEDNGDILPDEEDLEYPDLSICLEDDHNGSNSQTDATLVVELPIDFKDKKESNSSKKKS